MDILPGFQVGMNLVRQAQAMKEERLNMMSKVMEQKQESELFPLRIQEVRQGLKLKALQADVENFKREQFVGMAEADAAVAKAVGEVPPTDPSFFTHIMETIAAHPKAANSQLLPSIMQDHRAAMTAKGEIERAKITAGKGTAFDQEYNQFQAEQDNLKSLTSRYESMPNTDPSKPGLQAEIEKSKQKVEMLGAKLKGPSTNLSVTSPTGEVTNLTIGSGMAQGIGNIQQGLQSRGLVTKIAPKIAQYENAMELVKDLEHDLTAGDVGIRGLIKEYRGKILGQFTKGQVDEQTIKTRSKITQLRESVAREIPEGGRETERQRQDVLNSLPTTGIFESEDNARAALKATRELLASRARNYAAEIGRVPLVSMTPDQIRADYISDRESISAKLKKGLITRDEANAILSKSNEEHNQALARFHP